MLSVGIAAVAFMVWVSAPAAGQGAVTIEQVTNYAYPSGLIAAPSGYRVVWTAVQRGVRRIWGADGPAFRRVSWSRTRTTTDRPSGHPTARPSCSCPIARRIP
jgi:hypothetical protein